MQRYVLMRALQGLAVLAVVSIIIFLLARLSGDPLMMMLPNEATQEDFARMRQLLGLDQPLHVQYWKFITGFAHADLGTSITMRTPVRELLLAGFPNTLKLVLLGLGIAVLVGFPLGVTAAARRGSKIDSAARMIAVAGMAAPSFWVGLVLMEIFAVQIPVFPPGGMEGPSYYVLPSLTLSFYFVAVFARMLRSGMLAALGTDYVRMARMKGVSQRTILWKHCLRNALLPVLTYAGVYLGILITGSVVIETVFAWPGVGRLTYQAVIGRDYPLIQSIVMVVATLVLAINLLVDILYAYLDPRIRYT